MKTLYQLFYLILVNIVIAYPSYSQKGEDDVINVNANNSDFIQYLKSDTIINLKESTTYNIDNEDIFLNINNLKNLTINGNGATLNFEKDGLGIDILNSSYITIKNLKITSLKEDGSYSFVADKKGRINAVDSRHIVVENVVMEKQNTNTKVTHFSWQVHFDRCEFSKILSSEFYNSDGELIVLRASKDCLVKDNYADGGSSGIATTGYVSCDPPMVNIGYRNRIIQNTVIDSKTAFITINDRDAFIDGNIVYSSDTTSTSYSGPGIRLGHHREGKCGDVSFHDFQTALNAKVINNRIYNLTKYKWGKRDAPYRPIAIWANKTSLDDDNAGDGIIIENNTIENCKVGVQISVTGGQSGTISSNHISTTNEAISLVAGSQNPHQFDIEWNRVEVTGNNPSIMIDKSNANLRHNTVIAKMTNPDEHAILFKNTKPDLEVNIINNELDLNGSSAVEVRGFYGEKVVLKDNLIRKASKAFSLKSDKVVNVNNRIEN